MTRIGRRTGYLLLFGCAAQPLAPSPPARSEPQAPSAAATQAPAAGFEPARVSRWQRRIDHQLASVAELRELRAKARVEAHLLSRAEMARAVTQQLTKQWPPAQLRAQQTMLTLLGLVPTDFDLVESIHRLLLGNLAGFYDPEQGAMVVAADLEDPELQTVLDHELVHALQDQHYQLGALLEPREGAGDVQAAIHALAEGDATLAMLQSALGGAADVSEGLPMDWLAFQMRGALELTTDAEVPGILKRSLVAAYTDGLAFARELHRQGGWAAIDAAWRAGVASTEQVLHPDKWRLREPPEAVAFPGPPPGVALEQRVFFDVMGEQALRQVLAEWVPRLTSERAAAGWAGDGAAFYQSTSSWFAWQIRFDTAQDRDEALDTFQRGLTITAGAPSGTCQRRLDRDPLLVSTQGRDLILVAGGGPQACAALRTWALQLSLQ